MTDERISLPDVAQAIGRSWGQTWRLVLTGVIPGERSGRHWTCRRADVEAFIKAGAVTTRRKPRRELVGAS